MQSVKALQRKAQDTSEFKQEAVRLVKSGKSALSVAKILNMPHQTLEHWLRLDRTAKLVGVDHKPVTVEQMELTRLRAENARLKMERDVLKKAGIFRKRASVKYAWINTQTNIWPIAIMCHVLCASERGYYHHNAHLARINNKRRSCQQRTCA